jgi:hypothetical protein
MKNFLKHNPIYTVKQATGAASTVFSLPKSKLLNDFMRIIQEPSILACGNNSLLIEAVKKQPKKDEPEKCEPTPTPAPPEDKDRAGENEKPPEPPANSTTTREEIELVVAHWNEICGEVLPKVKTLTETRKAHIVARLKEHPVKEWPAIFSRVVRSEFLTGAGNRGWSANFDWVMNPTNLVKILEGTYDDRTNTQKPKTGMDALKAIMEKSQAQHRTVEVGPNAGTDVRPGDGPDPEDVQY